MAVKNSMSTDNKKAILVISKDEFKKQLEKQIERGKKILEIQVNRIRETANYGWGYSSSNQIKYDEKQFDSFKKEHRAWITYVEELLKQSFDTPQNEYYKRFDGTGTILMITSNTDLLKEYRSEIKKKTDYLESLIELVPLLPCSIEDEKIPNQEANSTIIEQSKKILIVHGHDKGARSDVEEYVKTLGYTPIVLCKQASKGNTIIEKLEEESKDACFAIILYTACDEGRVRGESELNFRARQNVVFEHGMMFGILGRKNVAALVEDDIELPSDINGVIYIPFDDKGGWKIQLAKEMNAVGLEIDMNKLL